MPARPSSRRDGATRIDLDALAARLPPRPRTRFAPSPTGLLHLGHVVNAIYVWGLARALGGEVVVRVEDHDRTRSRREYVAAVLEDLTWLGFEADRELAGHTPWLQSQHEDGYRTALRDLAARGARLFWCRCSRRDILERSHVDTGHEPAYPMTCERLGLPEAPGHGLRLVLPAGPVTFDDPRLGALRQDPRTQCRALLLRDRDGCWTYQFAVAVDDLRHRIDFVVRGDDLVESTGRQILVARMLGRETPAVFVHHGLIRHPHGDKLSKSNRDTGVRALREAGWTAGAVIGHAAHLVGLSQRDQPVEARDVVMLFGSRR